MREELGDELFVKVPVSAQGIKAIGILSREGILITATAIYTPMQAFIAAKAGARYTAPYVNRIDNMGADGVQAAKDIHDMFRIHGLTCEVLAASFKNSQQILKLCKHGIGPLQQHLMYSEVSLSIPRQIVRLMHLTMTLPRRLEKTQQ